MDEMRIQSKFTTDMISRIIRFFIQKKLGYDVGIRLNEFDSRIDSKTHIHLDLDLDIANPELRHIITELLLKN